MPEVSNVHRATLVTERSDQYYEDEAPTHWELGDVETALRPGTPADPWAYCARFGAMPDDGRDPPPRSSGRLCGVVGGGSIQWAALALVAVIALARRRRRGHRS